MVITIYVILHDAQHALQTGPQMSGMQRQRTACSESSSQAMGPLLMTATMQQACGIGQAGCRGF